MGSIIMGSSGTNNNDIYIIYTPARDKGISSPVSNGGDVRNRKSDDPDDGDDISAEISNEVETVTTHICKAADMITHALTTSPVYDPYTNRSLASNILGILLYMFDYVSDIVVAYLLK